MVQRRRRTAAVAVLLLAAGMVFVDLARGAGERDDRRVDPAAGQALAPPAPTEPGDAEQADAEGAAVSADVLAADAVAIDGEPPQVALRFPVTGPGVFEYAALPGVARGAAGTVQRYRVAVESGSGQDATAFARTVDGIFADPRGWTASGRLRLQRVPKGASADFTIFLATPGTSERMCAAGGLHTERFTSCRLPGQVIINLTRWWRSVPGYGAPLTEYQTYAINHEVGHQLGFGHEGCPVPGLPAPVMQQQTLGLRGCKANGWPYVDGVRYSGPPIP
jgi:hypothetical protein